MSPLHRNPPPRDDPRPAEYARSLGTLRLYLNDLDDVARWLRPRTSAASLWAGDAIADEPADLRDAAARELRAVRFVTSDPAVVVDLHRSRARASTTDSTDDARALVDDVYRLLRVRHQRRVGFIQAVRSNALGVFVTAVALATLFGVLTLTGSWASGVDVSQLGALLAVAAAFGFAFGTWLIFLRVQSGGCAMIIPETRSDQRGFTRQARHDWMLGGTTFVLGALLSYALTYWQLKD